ncbi:hypothetical protein GIB67_018510 [Kingdonia uniflora]|uniref:protein-serine/threonine phosphatase n=1 Tax=Kingdonia uniflora TaxID=39325 RepID=A0A7J7LW90_9MAGN|nr:hypothetical protein GIB67_018510 [Kingdonia uniflora]
MVSSGLMKIVSPCWKGTVGNGDRDSDRRSRDDTGKSEGLLWYKDLGRHVNGEFSMAVIQANMKLEDQCQVESGPLSSIDSGPPGTFVGIYDGHGGPEAARFVNDRLFRNLKRFTLELQGMSNRVISRAYAATEEEFLGLVKKQWLGNPQIATVGSCCLVGIICSGSLYIANTGDSRAVLGRSERALKIVRAVQLSSEHNASIESVREELRSWHPDDPQIVVVKNKVWRVKGIIQISRSIGDAYLKRVEFNREPILPKYRVPKPFPRPILSAEPSILMQRIGPQDKFLIFGSDGLWEHISNQEAVDIVDQYPRNGIARRLLKTALREAAKKREMRYADLKKIDRGVRRHFHDDITVIVLFLDQHLINKSSYRGPKLSIKGIVDSPAIAVKP